MKKRMIYEEKQRERRKHKNKMARPHSKETLASKETVPINVDRSLTARIIRGNGRLSRRSEERALSPDGNRLWSNRVGQSRIEKARAAMTRRFLERVGYYLMV